MLLMMVCQCSIASRHIKNIISVRKINAANFVLVEIDHMDCTKSVRSNWVFYSTRAISHNTNKTDASNFLSVQLYLFVRCYANKRNNFRSQDSPLYNWLIFKKIPKCIDDSSDRCFWFTHKNNTHYQLANSDEETITFVHIIEKMWLITILSQHICRCSPTETHKRSTTV